MYKILSQGLQRIHYGLFMYRIKDIVSKVEHTKKRKEKNVTVQHEQLKISSS